VASNYIIRLNSDGTKDTSFNIGTGFNNSVKTIELQPDGKILVGGSFTTYNGLTENRIIRLNINGTKDTSFLTGAGFNGTVEAIRIYDGNFNAGEILVGGRFSTYKNLSRNRIARLTINGNADTFNIGTGFNFFGVSTIDLQVNKILIGGAFSSYNGTVVNNIIRLNYDGTIDNSFITGTGFNNYVNKIKQQPDGKIIVGGGFTSFNEVTVNKLIRLNADGTKDTSFNTGIGFDNFVNSIELQSDGKILVGGNFNSSDGITENKIVRLNTNGSKDYSFNTGIGFDNEVLIIILNRISKIT
jgi:uncharacterized delta-60 repeat protein